MELTVLQVAPESVRAGYACPCGCTPSVDYARSSAIAEEGCCCGNEFAVGPRASSRLAPRAGFRSESQSFDAPWGERLEAAWLVGPSVHGPSEDHGHDHHAEAAHDTVHRAIDPVCGMTVDPDAARAKGLTSIYADVGYFFCGKGCKLDFDESPEQYLQPGYVPSM